MNFKFTTLFLLVLNVCAFSMIESRAFVINDYDQDYEPVISSDENEITTATQSDDCSDENLINSDDDVTHDQFEGNDDNLGDDHDVDGEFLADEELSRDEYEDDR